MNLTLEYLVISVTVIMFIPVVVKFIIPHITRVTIMNKYSSLFLRISNGIEFLRMQPAGYELIIANPDKLPGLITQEVDDQGRPYIVVSPANRYYARSMKIYYVNITNLGLHESVRIDREIIKITKIGTSGNVTLIRIS